MFGYIIKACMAFVGVLIGVVPQQIRTPTPDAVIDERQFFVATGSTELTMEWTPQGDLPLEEQPQPDATEPGPVEATQEANRQPGGTATRFVASCQGELDAWQEGLVPSDRYWIQWNDGPAPWCSEFVGWNLQNIGLVEGETMPPDPSYAAAYYSFYSERPDLAEVHENDGTYAPRAGDIVLFSEFSHTEMIEQVDEDGLGWSGISGGSSVDRVHRNISDSACQWFITLL